jgi:hypothetical protein
MSKEKQRPGEDIRYQENRDPRLLLDWPRTVFHVAARY